MSLNVVLGIILTLVQHISSKQVGLQGRNNEQEQQLLLKDILSAEKCLHDVSHVVNV